MRAEDRPPHRRSIKNGYGCLSSEMGYSNRPSSSL